MDIRLKYGVPYVVYIYQRIQCLYTLLQSRYILLTNSNNNFKIVFNYNLGGI